MSIHKSKGLEFPVVFLAGLGKGFNLRDASQPLVLDPVLGIGLKPVFRNTRLKTSTTAPSPAKPPTGPWRSRCGCSMWP